MDSNAHAREWFQELQNPIWGMLTSREIFRSWKEVVRAAEPEWPEHTNGYFIEWVNRNYLKSLMVAIRTMNDRRKDARSLRRFLQYIKKHPLPNVPPDRIDGCLDRLTKVSENVHKHVNVQIAPLQPVESRRPRSDIRAHPRSRRHHLRHLPRPVHDHRRRNRHPPKRRRLSPVRPVGVPIHRNVDNPRHSMRNRAATPQRMANPRPLSALDPTAGRSPRPSPATLRTLNTTHTPSHWSSPRWPDTSRKSAFDVREWTQRVGKESCWEGNEQEEGSRMSSNVDAVEIVRSSGKPVRQVANELGIYDSTLGNWVRQDGINRGEREGLSTDERERLRELERENARLRMERELEKTSCGLLGEGVERVMLYRFVDAQKAEGFPVRMVCSVVGVSPGDVYSGCLPSSWGRLASDHGSGECGGGSGGRASPGPALSGVVGGRDVDTAPAPVCDRGGSLW